MKQISLFILRIATLVASIMLLRILGGSLSSVEYDVFVIIRQIIGWFVAFSFLGMATALPRTIVAHREQVLPEYTLMCALGLVLPSVTIVVALAYVWPETLAYLLFKTTEFTSVVAPLAMLAGGMAVLSLINLYFRGTNRFRLALGNELMCQGLVPLGLVFVMYTNLDLLRYLDAYIIGLFAVLCVILSMIVRRAYRDKIWKSLGKKNYIIKDLLNYGIPKFVSGMYQMFLIGAFPVAMRWSGATLQETAAAVLGMSLGITASTVMLTVNSTVTFNDIVAAGRGSTRCVDLVRRIVQLAAVGCVIMCGLGAVGADIIVKIMIGPMYNNAAIYINGGAVLGLFYYGIGMLEIPLDALEPPWRKSVVSIAMLAIVSGVIASLQITHYTAPHGLIACMIAAQAIYMVLLVMLISKRIGSKVVNWRNIVQHSGIPILMCISFALVRMNMNSAYLEMMMLAGIVCCVMYMFYKWGFITTMCSLYHNSSLDLGDK